MKLEHLLIRKQSSRYTFGVVDAIDGQEQFNTLARPQSMSPKRSARTQSDRRPALDAADGSDLIKSLFDGPKQYNQNNYKR